MNELALFAGAGGGILGGQLLGWRTVCAVEVNDSARRMLLARQRDGFLDRFPIWDDVKTFIGHEWRGTIDVVSGGFPCTDISSAGKGAGIDGDKSSLWKEMHRIISEVRPSFAYLENSPLLRTRGLAVVIGDLAEIGYGIKWCCLSASDVGANHKRERMWGIAFDSDRYSEPGFSIHDEAQRLSQFRNGYVPYTDSTQCKGGSLPGRIYQAHANASDSRWWIDPPRIHRVANGVADRMDRLKAIGNGQVPRVAACAWQLLSKS